MIQIKSVQNIQVAIQNEKSQKKTIGFVPTMGALHNGHLSLIRRSISENDITVVSIFVNPTQFGPNEDFDHYPRPIDTDLQLLNTLNVNYVFTPTSETCYGKNSSTATRIHIPDLSRQYCGQSRPQFFDGVCSIVARLFNCITPTHAYFGKKDFQQLHLIKKMVSDLLIPIKIIGCPIIREDNGLAISSRNHYLTDPQKEEASQLFKMLQYGKKLYQSGETNTHQLHKKMTDFITQKASLSIDLSIDYIEYVDTTTLRPVTTCTDHTQILVAGYLNQIRLIDNLKISH
jgi:pantoate--beta-alanine ligase